MAVEIRGIPYVFKSGPNCETDVKKLISQNYSYCLRIHLSSLDLYFV